MSHFPGLAIALMATTLSGPAAALTNLVTNGGFENVTNGFGVLGYKTNVVGWVDTKRKNGEFGQDYVYKAGTADTKLPKYPNLAGYDNGELWGPSNGGAPSNDLPPSSPAGGNFVGLSGGQNASSLTQTISGLQTGRTYDLTFDYAFAQGFGSQIAGSMDFLSASLGSQTLSTATYTIPSRGFAGWDKATFVFKNFAGADTLSFLAHGMAGAPPFALLDGVTLTSPAPEPAAWVMVLIGVGGLGSVARRRRASCVQAV